MISTTISYKWQRSANGIIWTDIAGATESTYWTPVDLVQSWRYRCITTERIIDLEKDYVMYSPEYLGANVSREIYALRTHVGDLLNLIPSQFQKAEKIVSILIAMARQFDELAMVYKIVNVVTDIDTAVGSNLDRVGEIVSLSRTEAFEILNRASNVALDDGTYRKTLKFGIIQNNTNGCYADVIKGLRLLWEGVDTSYSESYEDPATFRIVLNRLNIDNEDPSNNVPLIIKSAGVQTTLSATFLTETDMIDEELFGNESTRLERWVFCDGEFTMGECETDDREFQPKIEVIPL